MTMPTKFDRSHRTKTSVFLAMLLSLTFVATATAQRNLKDIPDPDPELERQELIPADGFEVSLFAADPLIAKPTHMNFDNEGRLWIASSEIYPQVKPGQKATDKILVVEDTDSDGVADKTTVFADGLLIPTGVLPGDGGVYISNSTELLFLKDTDGDGKADYRRVMLSGFGTEDTHHILHTLRWGPDGMLYMNQSIYIHSHIETPYGVRRMNGGGVWHFRPETMELDTFTLGLVNSWGHTFDRFGQSFQTDGAGGDGINYVFPGFVGVTSPGAPRVLRGLNPGSPKHCGLEVVSGRHFPPEWQGNMITNDFRAHRVWRFALSQDGSGFASRKGEDLVSSTHQAFRPIDVKMGPDGAMYIADWYNPIIQHGEVDFRDSRRDHVHGRIWRVTAKGRPLAPRPRLVGASVAELLDYLKSPEGWTRQHAKQTLKERGADNVLSELKSWIASLDVQDPELEHHRLEGLWVYQGLDRAEPNLLRELMRSNDSRVRAAATRVLYHWSDRVDDALALLAERIDDEHPRVRLEAVRALSRQPVAQACPVAMRALDQSMDRFLDYALWHTARDLRDAWLPALQDGQIDFGGNTRHLMFALKAIDSPEVVPLLVKQLTSTELDSRQEESVLLAISALGTDKDLRLVFDLAIAADASPDRATRLLTALIRTTQQRRIRPAGDFTPLGALLSSADDSLRRAAVAAVGVWRAESFRPQISSLAADLDAAQELRIAAFDSLSALGTDASRDQLVQIISKDTGVAVKLGAATALVKLNSKFAAPHAAMILRDLSPGSDPSVLVGAFLARRNGPTQLATALADVKLASDVARMALRSVRSTGAEYPLLVEAIGKSGSLSTSSRKLTPELSEQLIAEAADHGSAVRGEAIYRRADLTCQKCHAIGGAGGRVGPDLVSLGASAPVDYIVEALLDPSKKVKENYHSLIVITDEGRLVTGVKVRETDKELILRDAEDRDLLIPLDTIDEQQDGGSLMPVGLTDSLTRAELVDLVKFLSELGKVGAYSLPKQRLARRWEAVEATPTNVRLIVRTGAETAISDDAMLTWQSEYGQVSGKLPIGPLPKIRLRGRGGQVSIIRLTLNVSAAGKVQLNWNDTTGLTFWVNKTQVPTEQQMKLQLDKGPHTVTVVIDRKTHSETISVELVDVPGSPARAQLAGGK